MSNEDWNLWFEYIEQKETIYAWYKQVWENDFPHTEFVEPTDEELTVWMEEIRAA